MKSTKKERMTERQRDRGRGRGMKEIKKKNFFLNSRVRQEL